MSDSVWPHGLQPTRLPRPWDSPGKNTGVGCHFLLQCMKVKRESEVAQSCPTLSDPMDCSLPGSSAHGIFQARILEWVAIAFDCVDHNKVWKILQQLGIPDHLTCLLRNLYAGQEATVRNVHGKTDWFQIRKGVHQGCILSYLTYMQSTSWEMLGWMKHKLGSRLLGEISITSDMQMTPPLWQKAKKN